MKFEYKKITMLLLAVVIFSAPHFLFSQQDVISQHDSLIQRAIELSIQHKYSDAALIFDQLIKNFPDHPAGYFFKAALIQSKMIDFETDEWEDDFLSNIHLTLKYSTKKNSPALVSDEELMFFKGSALSYLAFFEGRKGKYVPAIKHGFSGISMLKKLVAFEPDFFDAYFGIGSYMFWRSQITRHFNWLPLIPDEREQGLDLVQRAIKNGKFTHYAAMNEIVWILLEYEKPEEAFAWSMKGLEKFPDSRFFLWGAAKSASALKDYPAAIEFFQKLLASITASLNNNYYNEYICRLNLARCFFEIENYIETKNQLNFLKSLKLSSKIQKRLKKQLAQTQELTSKINEHFSTSQR